MNKVSYILGALLIVASTAFADTNRQAVIDANRHLNPPRVYTGIYQPHGKPTNASGFAPRPGRSGRHIYGAPIQSPILKMQPPKPVG
jgi:hypothetical protein